MAYTEIDPTVVNTATPAESAPETFTHEQLDEISNLYRDQYPRLLYKAKSFTRLPDPEGVVQTAFAKALRSWNSYEDRGYTRAAWLQTILCNTAISELRRVQRRPEAYSMAADGESLDIIDRVPDQSVTIEDDFIEDQDFAELMGRIKYLLADKPAHWYQITELLIKGYGAYEISDKLGLSKGTVASTTYRVRGILTHDEELLAALGRN